MNGSGDGVEKNAIQAPQWLMAAEFGNQEAIQILESADGHDAMSPLKSSGSVGMFVRAGMLSSLADETSTGLDQSADDYRYRCTLRLAKGVHSRIPVPTGIPFQQGFRDTLWSRHLRPGF